MNVVETKGIFLVVEALKEIFAAAQKRGVRISVGVSGDSQVLGGEMPGERTVNLFYAARPRSNRTRLSPRNPPRSPLFERRVAETVRRFAASGRAGAISYNRAKPHEIKVGGISRATEAEIKRLLKEAFPSSKPVGKPVA